jgi:Tat protein translocase TatB subunit
MPTISPVEFMVVAILALIVFGPNKLPEIARTVGRTISELRKQAEGLKAEFQEGLSLDDEPEPDRPAPDRPEPEQPAIAEDVPAPEQAPDSAPAASPPEDD